MEHFNNTNIGNNDSNSGAVELALKEIESPDIVALRRSGQMMPELSAIINAFVQAANGVKMSEFRGLLRVEGYAGTDRRQTRREPVLEQARNSV